jgi:hypothetical protein
VNTRAGLGLIVLATAVGLLSSATAQPPPPARNNETLNSLQNLQNPTYQSNPQDLGPNAGPPLFGSPRPDARPDPNPVLRVKRPTDCPFGYQTPRELQQLPHLVVCVLKPPYQPEYVNASPGLTIGAQPSAAPTTLERVQVNQCIGHPVGTYACGRGGSECCRPNQDNMCFAGAFACYQNGSGTGPKKACCMSR